MKKSFFRFCSVFALCLLLANPQLAYEGAKNGLMLWSQVVLPTLLPFMICSNVIVALDAVHILIFPVKRLLSSVLCLSGAGSYVLVSGMLCGYPMGAKICSEFMDSRRITTSEGRYLLAICNHPSPMFLLGYVVSLMPDGIPVWLLLSCVYLPIFPLALLAGRFYGIQKADHELPDQPPVPLNFDDSLMVSCEVMVKIGGYIMLFSILADYILHLPLENPALKAVFLGIVEITTGIQAIASGIPGMEGGVFIVAATAFGGLSGIFQTKSVIKNAGLSIRHYITFKCIHCLCSIVLFTLLVFVRQTH